MSYKNIKMPIDNAETNITIRRIKKKELKALAVKLGEKIDMLVKAPSNEALMADFPENIDFICDEMILPFTNLTPKQLDEMDVVDVVVLGKELLSFNKIDIEKIKSFLNQASETSAGAVNFQGVTIPSAN